jgi:hypothetical protein
VEQVKRKVMFGHQSFIFPRSHFYVPERLCSENRESLVYIYYSLHTLPTNGGWRGVDSSWNVMVHGDAQEGKWRGNWRMKWVASTLHTTSEHGVSSITMVTMVIFVTSVRHQLKCDGTRWRTGGEVKGGNWRMEWVASTLHTTSEHWCIQHYYRWCRKPRLYQ